MKAEALVVSAVNLSEGRRTTVIDGIVHGVPEPAKVLDVHSDPDHNRTVLTLAARPSKIADSVVAIGSSCIELLDLKDHQGAHPRLGTLDVVPLVPMGGLDLREIVPIARQLGQMLAHDLDLPCFLYDEASDSRVSLPEVRRWAFGPRVPDFGPREPHPSAGATCIGVRGHLIAFNVELRTSDLGLASQIAREMRAPDGMGQAIRSLAIPLVSKGTVQVSMNLIDPLRVTPAEALSKVELLARTRGVEVQGAEVVGLAPAACLEGLGREGVGLRTTHSLEEALNEAFGTER